MKRIAITLTMVLVTATPVSAENQVAKLRGNTALDKSTSPPPIANTINSDLRQVRNYPEQPPVIPHKIDGYQIDLNANKCMSCHSRVAVGDSQAPMISVTHFMNRDGQFLATVSPRRYFCTQCHVPATDARQLLNNTFVDVDSVLSDIKRNKR